MIKTAITSVTLNFPTCVKGDCEKLAVMEVFEEKLEMPNKPSREWTKEDLVTVVSKKSLGKYCRSHGMDLTYE